MRHIVRFLLISSGLAPALAAAQSATDGAAQKGGEGAIVVTGQRFAPSGRPGEPHSWRVTISRRF